MVISTRCALLLLALTSFSTQPYQSLMPYFAKSVYQGDSHTLGLLLSAAGFGAARVGAPERAVTLVAPSFVEATRGALGGLSRAAKRPLVFVRGTGSGPTDRKSVV